jgi:hypothetical protein
MQRFYWLSTVFALALGGGATLGATRAAAQECDTDVDCADGLICKSYGVQETCARPAIDCPEGQECPEPEPCEATEYKACALPPCETDDDCPNGTVCHTETYERCSTPPSSAEPAPNCAPGEECVQPEPPPCEDPDCKEETMVQCEEVTTEPACVPTWQLPCSADEDCGAGFTCEERVIESCSAGGSSTPSSGGGADGEPAPQPEPVEPECTSEPSGEFACVITVTECSTSDDCAAGFTCEENPSRPVCGGASERPADSGDGSSGSGDFAPPADGDAPVDSDCGIESTEPAKVCMPPYYSAAGGLARDAESAAGSGTGDEDGAGGEPPSDPQTTGGESDDEESASGMEESESKACAVVAPGASAGSSAVGLLGLIGMCALLRRRARKA